MTRKKTTTKAAAKKSSRPQVSRASSKRVASGRQSPAAAANFSDARDFKEVIRDFASNPAVKYVAGGIATAMLAKLASSLSGRYPEISRLLNENLENFEGKLREFRGGYEDQMDTKH